MNAEENKIRELITKLYPINDSDSPYLMVFQVVEVAKEFNQKHKYDLARRLSEISRLKGQVKALSKVSDMQEKEIKELKENLAQYEQGDIVKENEEYKQQIKELKEFAQHKSNCQYKGDVSLVKKGILPNLIPSCDCGLEKLITSTKR